MRSLQLLAAMILCTTPLALMSAPSVSGAQLLESCRAYRQEPRTGPGVFCAAYIRGFLDGTSILDGRCIDEQVAIDHIVVQLLEYASERSDADRLEARELLDATLRKMYGCHRKLAD